MFKSNDMRMISNEIIIHFSFDQNQPIMTKISWNRYFPKLHPSFLENFHARMSIHSFRHAFRFKLHILIFSHSSASSKDPHLLILNSSLESIGSDRDAGYISNIGGQ